MEEDIQRSREAGFTAHLTKPVNLQMLQEAILQATAALGRRRALLAFPLGRGITGEEVP